MADDKHYETPAIVWHAERFGSSEIWREYTKRLKDFPANLTPSATTTESLVPFDVATFDTKTANPTLTWYASLITPVVKAHKNFEGLIKDKNLRTQTVNMIALTLFHHLHVEHGTPNETVKLAFDKYFAPQITAYLDAVYQACKTSPEARAQLKQKPPQWSLADNTAFYAISHGDSSRLLTEKLVDALYICHKALPDIALHWSENNIHKTHDFISSLETWLKEGKQTAKLFQNAQSFFTDKMVTFSPSSPSTPTPSDVAPSPSSEDVPAEPVSPTKTFVERVGPSDAGKARRATLMQRQNATTTFAKPNSNGGVPPL